MKHNYNEIMKETAPLNIITGFNMKDRLIIHPNDGFDLDLYNVTYNFTVYINIEIEDFIKKNSIPDFSLNLNLANECKPGTIEMDNSFWLKIGKPDKIKLVIDDKKLLLAVV